MNIKDYDLKPCPFCGEELVLKKTMKCTLCDSGRMRLEGDSMVSHKKKWRGKR